MDTLMTILFVAAIVVIAIVICGLKDHQVWRGHRKRYLSMQDGRMALSDDAFCRQAGLDASVAGLVATVRSKLSQYGECDSLRIYPDDKFYRNFGLAYDDDVAFVVRDMGVIPGFHEYSFPLEEVDSVADFVRVILRLKREAETSNGGNAALGTPDKPT